MLNNKARAFYTDLNKVYLFYIVYCIYIYFNGIMENDK